MQTGHFPAQASAKVVEEPSHKGLLEDELLDLYSAILIVIPLLLLVKSLWL